ncbi:hypothetical protein LZC95_22665 [Pendulispora brunnea]|uniref:NodB homology domain-containing protein n=1 Tax=Pendulispora brunnea TaxID=2905690 RepID=A0ABZ2KRD2_9BACT
MAPIYLIVSIDCECDKGPKWRSQSPLAFTGVTEGIARRLQPLFSRYGAKPTYLLSAEVMRDPASADALLHLQGDHELGTHLHGEYAEPDAFEPEVTSAFQRDYPRDVEAAKLRYLTELFTRTFGRKPTSFRAGRFGIGPHSVPILEELDYLVESSVTPHMDWTANGAPGLTFRDAPTQPYHPDPREPGRPGTSRMLEVPVTIRPHRVGRVLPHLGWLGSRLAQMVEPRWLRPTRNSAEAMADVAREEIASAPRGKPVVLNAMFHNVEIIANGSPYAKNEREAQAILARLEGLLAFARAEGIKVVGLSDVMGIWSGTA